MNANDLTKRQARRLIEQTTADALKACTGAVAVTVRTVPTNTERRQALTAAGIIIKKTEDGEYRVNYRGASERYAAYESDLLAAIETGEAMNRTRPEIIKADIRIGKAGR